VSELEDEIGRFVRAIRAARKSPRTVEAYELAARQFRTFSEATGPVAIAEIRRRHVEDFILDILERQKPATALARYRSLQQFFRFLVKDEVIAESPMAKMDPPRIPEYEPRVLSEAELQRLLAACEGSSFEDRRDMALVRVLLDTGARRGEVLGLRWMPDDPSVNDVDLDRGVLRLRETKGGRERIAPIGQRTTRAIDRYLRLRDKHAWAAKPQLWLTRRGAMAGNGMLVMIQARGRKAGIEGLHPHVMRHTAAHYWLAGGGQEGDLMRIAGWRSRQMIDRYARTTAVERAITAHRSRSLSDRL
jgi:site-specific recombinase XerD